MSQQENFFGNPESFQQETMFATESASVGQRFINYFIDLIMFFIVIAGISVIIQILFAVAGVTYEDAGNDTLSGNQLFNYLISYSIYVIFYTFCEGASGGRTIGKLVTRTKAVREDETAITCKDAFMRSLCRIVPFDVLSAFSGYPWHDKWTNTKVIRNN
ncbi:RDD family protein [Panacibacter ginsenosidivorans]|uniref:RDD family protein n=1 Tax=Panacibacter ginsenosidivorans TaxID=1813871 RepID=A0A5B8VAN8_9BACT|nr:RDD family protein [Panacibacter ginsenosidivorans]QEC68537.1 RDD family protein [Panacibacter ginsenosidivorans]